MEQKDNSLRQKISSWLSNRDNSEGDLVDFLVDECGIVLEEEQRIYLSSRETYTAWFYDDAGTIKNKKN